MHELALSQNILAAVVPHVPADRRLVKVVVECDVCLGIVESALDYCFSMTAKHMGFNGATLEIHPIEADATCPLCAESTKVGSLFEACPSCGHAPMTVQGERGLRVSHIEVKEV
jgi:hydrogenase nickel incorporation protein HypA/HybF